MGPAEQSEDPWRSKISQLPYLHLSSWCQSPLGSLGERPRTHHLVQCPSCPHPYAHHSRLWHKAAEEDLTFIAGRLHAGQDVCSLTLLCYIKGFQAETVIVFIIINHLTGWNHLIRFYIVTKMELFYWQGRARSGLSTYACCTTTVIQQES